LLDWYKQRNEEVKCAFDELCPKNAKMTSGTIQKDLEKSCAQAITEVIKEEMGVVYSLFLLMNRVIYQSKNKWPQWLDLLAKKGKSMWDSVIEVLEIMNQDERNPSRVGGLVQTMESFSFVFIMKMMLQILRITNELSLILQRKDQNVVQAMSLIIDVGTRLNNLRAEDWEPLFEETKAFCLAKDIQVPNMSDEVPWFGRSIRGGRNNITQDHYFRIDIFYAAIDAIITEFV
jgi:hypothetical protein